MFAWAYVDESGEEVGRSPRFANADAAEEWIGSSWQDLYENGIQEVVLLDQARDRRVYRMGLGPE